jgi:hypothetical protein
MADNDAIDVTAQHRAIPNARMRAERHVADDGRVFGEVNDFAEPWLFAKESVELFVQIAHAFRFYSRLKNKSP